MEDNGCNFDFAGSWALLGLTTNSLENNPSGIVSEMTTATPRHTEWLDRPSIAW